MSATLLIINLLGTVALLLWGIRMVRTGVERAYGGSLRVGLGRALGNRLRAFAAGMGVTIVLQSATATCLLVASFAGQGLLPGASSLAAMLGADLGTAIAAQILSLDISWASPLLILVGFVLFQRRSGRRPRSLARVLLGLGLIFLALSMIVHLAVPIREAPLMLQTVDALGAEPALAILLAALLTWLAHSSLATVLFIASLAATGSLPLPVALTLVLGANLGSAMPALGATWHGGPAARRVAVGNGAFKLIGCLIVVFLVGPAAGLLESLTDDPERQVMAAHLVFNLLLVLAFLPLTGLAAAILERLLPDLPAPKEAELDQPRFLVPADLSDPAMALGNAGRETLRMGDIADRMLAGIGSLLRRGDRQAVTELSLLDDALDNLYIAIKRYLTEVRREPLEPDESRRCGDLMDFATNLEHVGDIIDKNLLDAIGKKVKRNLKFSEEGLGELDDMLTDVRDSLRLALNVLLSRDRAQARALLQRNEIFRNHERRAQERHYLRLEQGVAASLETSELHLDILRDLTQINAHLTSVAYPILEEAGDLYRSRLRKGQADTSSGGELL